MTTPFKQLPFLAFTMLLLAGCSAGGVRGEAPFVQVTSWRLDGDTVTATLRLRNVNDEELVIDAVTLNVDLDDSSFVNHSESRHLEVAANGFETLTLDMRATAEGAGALERLGNGETASLPYSLTGDVDSPDEGRLEFSREGHIYPVPGRPGQFR